MLFKSAETHFFKTVVLSLVWHKRDVLYPVASRPSLTLRGRPAPNARQTCPRRPIKMSPKLIRLILWHTLSPGVESYCKKWLDKIVAVLVRCRVMTWHWINVCWGKMWTEGGLTFLFQECFKGILFVEYLSDTFSRAPDFKLLDKDWKVVQENLFFFVNKHHQKDNKSKKILFLEPIVTNLNIEIELKAKIHFQMITYMIKIK